MAVTGNGTAIAYDATTVCGQGLGSAGVSVLSRCGHTPSNCSLSTYLAVVNTSTGQTKRWTYTSVHGIGGRVSLSADGGTVTTSDWVLRTNAAPGKLTQRGRVVARNGEFGPSTILGGGLEMEIAPDGKTVYFATFRINHDKPVGRNWQLRAFDVGTGQTRLVRSFPGTPVTAPVAIDPTGRYLLVEYIPSLARPATARLARLDIATGQVTQLNEGWAAWPASSAAIAW
jgi:hypothetical protein